MKGELQIITHEQFIIELQRDIPPRVREIYISALPVIEKSILEFLRKGGYVIQRPWTAGKRVRKTHEHHGK